MALKNGRKVVSPRVLTLLVKLPIALVHSIDEARIEAQREDECPRKPSRDFVIAEALREYLTPCAEEVTYAPR